jgi:hypothetical protein
LKNITSSKEPLKYSPDAPPNIKASELVATLEELIKHGVQADPLS